MNRSRTKSNFQSLKIKKSSKTWIQVAPKSLLKFYISASYNRESTVVTKMVPSDLHPQVVLHLHRSSSLGHSARHRPMVISFHSNKDALEIHSDNVTSSLLECWQPLFWQRPLYIVKWPFLEWAWYINVVQTGRKYFSVFKSAIIRSCNLWFWVSKGRGKEKYFAKANIL